MARIPPSVALRTYANGAARGELEQAFLLVKMGDFLKVSDVLDFIAKNQRITPDVFELVCSAWSMVELESDLSAMPTAPSSPPRV